ncbi:hypothetical protein G9A89_022366 [Geosiphon pyriformis]|nr:hypothetical protein G9A89_022366 [Geosiphon pyriformis]
MSETPESTGNEAFVKAAKEAKDLKSKPKDGDLLSLYALYKQGILGDNTTSKPGFTDFKNKAKWDAWNEKKGLSKEEAQTQYIELVAKLQGN